jgi:predicted HicB family RNase H-like nuclease
MTWRVSDELLEQVRRHAQRQGRSLNEWATTVMTAATDPAYAGDEAAALR